MTRGEAPPACPTLLPLPLPTPTAPPSAPVPQGMAVLELLHPGQHGQVLLTAQMPVVAPRVPWVEGVESDHVESLGTGGSHPARCGLSRQLRALPACSGISGLGWIGLH